MHRLIKTYHLYLLLSAMATLWSCREDVREFIPYEPTLEDLSQLLSQAPDAATRTVFQLGGALPDTILTAASGVRVILADTENLFEDENGALVPCSTCPDLKITVTTVVRKGDFLARNLSTTEYPASTMLESAGAVHVQATCGNKVLKLHSNRYLKVQIPSSDIKSDMMVYTGVLDVDKNVTGWQNTHADAFWAQWVLPGSGAQQSGYELIVPQIGWSNCARGLPEQSSSFCVTLPEQFTALNARVYLVFQNTNAIAELKGDDGSSEFCFPEAPLGYPVHIVVVGKTGEQYWLSNSFTEIGTNVKIPVSPLPMQEQDLITFLKNL